jgi:hypothetical protein
MANKRFIPTVLAAVLVATTAASAQAGQYHVYTCRTPAGESAPADGWSGSLGAGGAFDDYAINTCSSGGALIAALGDQTTHLANTDRATWSFEVPSFAVVNAATLSRAAYLHGKAGEKASYQFWLAGPTPTGVFEECIFTAGCHVRGEPSLPASSANRLEVPAGNRGSHIYVNVSCGAGAPGNECLNGFSDANNYAAVVYLFAGDITLEQTGGPAVSGVTGELASAPLVSGTSDVAFTATDPGSGVYQALLSVDGTVAKRVVLDENGGRCRNVGQTTDGLPAFLYVQPCLGSLSADVGLDTTGLANGSHHLLVNVIDAAGNSAPVLDRNITVANGAPGGAGGGGQGGPGPAGAPGANGAPGAPGAANGANASSLAQLSVSWRGSRSVRLGTPFGRTATIVGRLTGPGGLPIAGAQIDLSSTPSSTGARAAAMASPHTAADGTFTVRIPAGACSQALLFAYRSHLGDALPAVTRTLLLSVQAGVRLTITPRTSRVGGRIFFGGGLLGGRIPASGKLLVLEARSGGGSWLKFDVIHSDRRGRFHASYRFRFPGPARYQFRVVSEPEADYPFAAGSSNPVGVRER